ncbi:hypothetical protein [Mycobacterium sp. NPDC004974]
MAERWTRQRVQAELPAKALIAANVGITLGSPIDSEDLYRPLVEMVVVNVESAESTVLET